MYFPKTLSHFIIVIISPKPMKPCAGSLSPCIPASLYHCLSHSLTGQRFLRQIRHDLQQLFAFRSRAFHGPFVLAAAGDGNGDGDGVCVAAADATSDKWTIKVCHAIIASYDCLNASLNVLSCHSLIPPSLFYPELLVPTLHGSVSLRLIPRTAAILRAAAPDECCRPPSLSMALPWSWLRRQTAMCARSGCTIATGER